MLGPATYGRSRIAGSSFITGCPAAQVFAIAAETGWGEERILSMPLARLAQYQHCLLRRNGVAAHWSNTAGVSASVLDELRALRERWLHQG